MNNMSPLLSIIIATRNCADDLKKTLDSISQTIWDVTYEIIIQDGNSSDHTLSVAASYPQLNLHVESSPDTGVYDAWNKAVQRASGEWILFMGAGDFLCVSTSVQDVLQQISHLPQTCQYYSIPVISILPSGEFIETLYPTPTPFTDLLHGMCLPHQGLFHRKNLFLKQSFNISYKIAGDYDFVCRTLTANNFCIGSKACVCMSFGGISSDLWQMARREKEFLRIARNRFPTRFPWKILLRLLRWNIIDVISQLVGEKWARRMADSWRLLIHKQPVWTRRLQWKKLTPLPMRPYFALCIATLGRVKELDRLLSSLANQTYPYFHIYLADQNPEGTLDTLLKCYDNLSITRICLPSQGVSIARNTLLSIIDNEDIVAFPDDDCWYATNTLEQVVVTFCNSPHAGALLGISLNAEENPQSSSYTCPVSQLGTFKHGETYLQFFRKETLQNLQFDPQLGPGTNLPYGCGEDTDFLLEIYKRTLILRCKNIRIFHNSPSKCIPSDNKIASYAAGRMFLLRKHHLPIWFRCANALYPLLMLPIDLIRFGYKMVHYRWHMFIERCKNF